MNHSGLFVENVWDYPRPPRLESVHLTLKVIHQGKTLAHSTSAFRVLETSHPPTYYFPPDDVDMQRLVPNKQRTFCEWKGQAHYFDLELGNNTVSSVAWAYGNPVPDFKAITGFLAFYSNKVDECWVGDERVQSQAGQFYGGWITQNLTGPFKGEVGSEGW